MTNNETCQTCKYWLGEVCINGDSPHAADFRSQDDACDAWLAMNKEDVEAREDLAAEYSRQRRLMAMEQIRRDIVIQSHYAGIKPDPCTYRHLLKRNLHRLMEHFKTHNEMGNFQYV